ncbi:hypothetical protein HMPREF9123_1367 [Neisseria bacilliformis ATCC BAA-1200]|uniref:Uncharacterized protein n=1 Tax=Neisseria bacilliformis ATCC BAA-1200 TaxID=888742 RepID=F2BCD9_9NEIS|nr:hypothetical protein HMPREF9123_1367 [Neisseria bacilliformis ATCC BAA-1200]
MRPSESVASTKLKRSFGAAKTVCVAAPHTLLCWASAQQKPEK